MKSAQAIAVLLLACFLAGCVLKGKQQPAQVTPPPPQPVAQPAPEPVPGPLSIPQTHAELPPPQPVSAEAKAAADLQGEPLEPATAPPRSTGGTRRGPVGPPPIAAPRTEAPAAAPPAATPAPVTTPETNPSPPIQEILSDSEQKRLQEAADTRKREIKQLLEQANSRKLSRHETSVKKTVESYLKLSDQAELKGDMRQASEIAERAWVLMKDLQSGR